MFTLVWYVGGVMGEYKLINKVGRTCNKCGEFKDWDKFYKKKSGANGRTAICIKCFKKDRKDAYDRNPEKYLAKNKVYYYNNRENLLNQKHEYYIKNIDSITKYHEEYYEENRDSILNRKHIHGMSPANYITYGHQLTELEDATENREGLLLVRCATCGEYFIPTVNQVSNRIKSLQSPHARECRLYCSDSCKASCSVFGQKKYPKDFTAANSREFTKEFRDMVLEKDDYTCQMCGSTEDLEAHHINPRICSPMEQVDIVNGITLCKSCHIKAHDQDGCRYHELANVI